MVETDKQFTPRRTSRQQDLIKTADCGQALCDVCEPNFDPDSGKTTLGPNSTCQGVIGAAQPLQTLTTDQMMSSTTWNWEEKKDKLKYYSSFYKAAQDNDKDGMRAYWNDAKCTGDPSAESCNVWTRGNTNFNKMLAATDTCKAYSDGSHFWVKPSEIGSKDPWLGTMGMASCNDQTEPNGPEWCQTSNRGSGAPEGNSTAFCGNTLGSSGCSAYDPESNTVKLGYYSKAGGCIPGTVGMNMNTQKKFKLIVAGSAEDFDGDFKYTYKNPVGGYTQKGVVTGIGSQIAETAPCTKQKNVINRPRAVTEAQAKGAAKSDVIILAKANPAVIPGLSVVGANIDADTFVASISGTNNTTVKLSKELKNSVSGTVSFFAPNQPGADGFGPSRAQAAYTFSDFNVYIDPPRFPIVALHKVWGSGTDPNGCAKRGCDVKDNPLNNRGVNGKNVYISKEEESIRFIDPSDKTKRNTGTTTQRVLVMEAHGDLYPGDIGGLKKGPDNSDARANSCVIRGTSSNPNINGRPSFTTSFTDCGDSSSHSLCAGEGSNTDAGCRVDLPKCPNWVELTPEDGEGWNKRVGGCGATRDSYGPGVYNLLCYLPGTENENDTLGKAISRRLGRAAMRGYVFAIWPFHYEEIYARAPNKKVDPSASPDKKKQQGVKTPGQYRTQRNFPCFNSCDGPEYCESKMMPYQFTYMTKDGKPVTGTFPCPQAGTASWYDCGSDKDCIKGSQDAGDFINMTDWWGDNLQTADPKTSAEGTNRQSCASALTAATTGPGCNQKLAEKQEYDSFSVINHEIDIEIPTNAPGLDWDVDMTWDTMNANLWMNDINNYDADTGAYYSLAANRADNPDKQGAAFLSETPDDNNATTTKDYHWFTIDWYVDDDNPENNYVAFYYDDPFDPDADEEDGQPVSIHSVENGVIRFPKAPTGKKLSETNGRFGLVHNTQRFVPTRGGRLNFGPWMAWWGYGGNKGHTPAFNTAKVRLAHMSIIPYLKHPPNSPSTGDCTRESCIPAGYSFPQSFDQASPDDPDDGVLCDFVNLYSKRDCDNPQKLCKQSIIKPYSKDCKGASKGDVGCFGPPQACDASKMARGLNCYPYTPPPETWRTPPKKSHKWLYIGLGIGGGVLLIAGIILLIYFLVIKPHAKGKAAKTDSSKMGAGPSDSSKTKSTAPATNKVDAKSSATDKVDPKKVVSEK